MFGKIGLFIENSRQGGVRIEDGVGVRVEDKKDPFGIPPLKSGAKTGFIEAVVGPDADPTDLEFVGFDASFVNGVKTGGITPRRDGPKVRLDVDPFGRNFLPTMPRLYMGGWSGCGLHDDPIYIHMGGFGGPVRGGGLCDDTIGFRVDDKKSGYVHAAVKISVVDDTFPAGIGITSGGVDYGERMPGVFNNTSPGLKNYTSIGFSEDGPIHVPAGPSRGIGGWDTPKVYNGGFTDLFPREIGMRRPPFNTFGEGYRKHWIGNKNRKEHEKGAGNQWQKVFQAGGWLVGEDRVPADRDLVFNAGGCVLYSKTFPDPEPHVVAGWSIDIQNGRPDEPRNEWPPGGGRSEPPIGFGPDEEGCWPNPGGGPKNYVKSGTVHNGGMGPYVSDDTRIPRFSNIVQKGPRFFDDPGGWEGELE